MPVALPVEVIDAELVPHRTWKQKLANASRAMGRMEQVECPTKHYFAAGLYVREVLLPAGAVVIGKIHKHSHINVLLKGRVVLVGEDGERTELVAPLTFTSPAGVQKAVHILEETIWQNIHASTERDLDALEAQLIEPDSSYLSVDRTEERKAIADAARSESQLLLEHK